jgi:D-alanine-D-alanine ligase
MDERILILVNREKGEARPDVSDVLKSAEAVLKALETAGRRADLVEVFPDLLLDPSRLAKAVRDRNPSVILNLFEGFEGRPETEVAFARVLETLGIPFTGNRAETLERCLDKSRARILLAGKSVPVAPGRLALPGSVPADFGDLGFPLFLKPSAEDGSVGIDGNSLVRDAEELAQSLAKKLSAFPSGLLVERFLPGRECAAGFVGNGESCRCVGVSMLDYGKAGPGFPPYLGFGAKWAEDTDEYKVLMPRILDPENGDDAAPFAAARDLGARAGKALGCTGYFRVDMREGENELFVLEVNPNPDISPDSGFMRMAAGSGLSYAETLELILEAARGRPSLEDGRHCPKNADMLP